MSKLSNGRVVVALTGLAFSAAAATGTASAAGVSRPGVVDVCVAETTDDSGHPYTIQVNKAADTGKLNAEARAVVHSGDHGAAHCLDKAAALPPGDHTLIFQNDYVQSINDEWQADSQYKIHSQVVKIVVTGSSGKPTTTDVAIKGQRELVTANFVVAENSTTTITLDVQRDDALTPLKKH